MLNILRNEKHSFLKSSLDSAMEAYKHLAGSLKKYKKTLWVNKP